jgi:hypothetical protein
LNQAQDLGPLAGLESTPKQRNLAADYPPCCRGCGHPLAFLPHKVIADSCAPELGPLMVRYFLIRTPVFAVYIHNFLRSDNDRHFHDHPWAFATFLLTSGYAEHVPLIDGEPMGGECIEWRRRFSLLFRPAEWKHWVEVPKPLWTLIFRLRRRREWGFWTEKGWVNWRTYGLDWCEDGASSSDSQESKALGVSA